jgi:uncharacterized membrane protein YeaQ/YmgE (transglycosylase-associated protein family)
MNVALWLVAGGLVGSIAFAALKLNMDRGLVLSVALGMGTALFGGHILAPIFGAVIGEAGELSPAALLVAAATALACLSIQDITSKNFGH